MELPSNDVSAAFELRSSPPAVWFLASGALQRLELKNRLPIPRPVKVTLASTSTPEVKVQVECDKAPEVQPTSVSAYFGRGGSAWNQEVKCSEKDSPCRLTKGTDKACFTLSFERRVYSLHGGDEIIRVVLEGDGFNEFHRLKTPLVLGAFLPPEYRKGLLGAGFGLVMLLGLGTLYAFFPLTFFRVYARFPSKEAWAWAPSFVAVPLEILRQLSLVPFLATRPRVLDAWVRSVAAKFTILADDYVPLPVTLKGKQYRFTEASKAQFLFEPTATGREQVKAIVAKGGSGKTMLLTWLLSRIASGLMGYPAIAVLVSSAEDPFFVSEDRLEGLKGAVGARLDPEHQLQSRFLRALLRSGRLVLAIDRLSELEPEAQSAVRQLRSTLQIRHLLLTRGRCALAGESCAAPRFRLPRNRWDEGQHTASAPRKHAELLHFRHAAHTSEVLNSPTRVRHADQISERHRVNVARLRPNRGRFGRRPSVGPAFAEASSGPMNGPAHLCHTALPPSPPTAWIRWLAVARGGGSCVTVRSSVVRVEPFGAFLMGGWKRAGVA